MFSHFKPLRTMAPKVLDTSFEAWLELFGAVRNLKNHARAKAIGIR
jgi:hypothetical protein